MTDPAQLIERVHALWAGRTAILLVNRYEGAIRALADEVHASGGRIVAVVAGGPFDPTQLPGARVWSRAEHGGTLPRREFDRWLRRPPAELADWLDTVDPAREALVLGTSYTDVGEFCGRPLHGWWRPGWQEWEDKTRIDELWRSAGVACPPYAVVDLDDPALAGHVARLDAGRGVVLAADASRSVLGSSKGLRWVRGGPEALSEAVSDLVGTTDRVRVAAFMPGVPMSILACVLPRGTAVFEPFEIVTLFDPASGGFVYGGTSTWWRATPTERDRIRADTRRVGEAMRAQAGYRGIFSVDGVVGPHGFAATELNPRHVSGLTLWAGWPQFPMRLFNRAVQEGEPAVADADPDALEAAVCAAIQKHPAMMVKLPYGQATGEPSTVELDVDGEPRRVTHRQVGGSTQLLDVDPMDRDGAIAPAAAALANLLGAPGLVSFRADPGRKASGSLTP
ncbi:hypothetical protein [Micromonospora sp. DT229]|uniref:hypothetical protein n=1 Tax=Micromonospora sp. DT229 TaxID=3393430 RepID=UPI003CE726EA